MSFQSRFFTLLLCMLGSSAALAQLAFAPAVNYPAGNASRAVAAADFNGDGRLDLAVVNQNTFGTGSVSILLAAGAPGSFGAPTNFSVGNQPGWVAVADFNGDGNLDIAVTNAGAGNVSILLGTGAGTFTGPTTLSPGGAFAVVAGDFNGDGRMDLAVTRYSSGGVSIQLGNGDGTFTAAATLPGTGAMSAIASADFNGDGRLDLAAIDVSNNLIHFYLGVGDGTFTVPGGALATGASPSDIAVGDFNGDGNADVAISNQVGSVSILLGNGTGGFTAAGTLTAGNTPRGVEAADLDRDGNLDLIVGAELSDRIDVFGGNGDGTFAAPLPFATGDGPFLATVADLDGDGRPDIVAANRNSGSGSVLLNATPVVPNPPTAASATSGNAQLSVAFAAPTDAASLPILDYTATCGAVSVTGPGSPILVTPLVNGTPVTCTVVARNATGTSVASAPSAAATPISPSSVALATSGTPSLVGASVTFTATVTGDNPAGTVNFSDGGIGIPGCAAVALAGGIAQCTTAFGTVGTKAITAGYSGNAANQPSNGTLAGGQVVTAALTSFTGPTATGTGNATVSFTGGGATCSFAPQGSGPGQSAFFIALSGHAKSPPAGSAPTGVLFPQGLLDFVLVNCTPGATVNFTVTYPTALPAGTQYWKYGPTPSNPAPHWYTLPAAISGVTATFSITDGALGDDDLAANGTVVDQGGPGTPAPGSGLQPVPTLSEWAMILLAMLLAAIGAARMCVPRGRRA